MLKRVITIIALSLVFTLPAAAQEFEQGLAAQKRGDFATALKIWQPLAERGHAGAQNRLGLLYDNGDGVPQDHSRALAWYRKAARQGLADAQYNLGLMYANGLAVRQDYEMARSWYAKAAQQGHTGAQVNLDVLYLMGHVTRKEERENRRAEQARSELAKLKAVAAPESDGTKPQRIAGGAVIQAKTAAEAISQPRDAEQAAAEAAAPLSLRAPENAAVIAKPKSPAGAGEPVRDSLHAKGAPEKAKSERAKTEARAAGGGFSVQLSSVKTKLRAMKEASRLKQIHKSLLGTLELETVRADLGDRGVFYRLRAGPLADWSSANALCRKLSSRNQSCIVVRQ